jgi:serine/threonine protein kinase
MSLAQYNINDIICEDIYSITYKAKNKIDNSNVILKKIKNGSINHRVQKIVENEIEKIKKISHIHIPPITDYFHNEINTYIVFNDYGNNTLRDRLYHKNMTLDNILSLYNKLINIIDYIHQLNIVHYDLKPENIIWNSSDIQLINFGSTILSNGICPKNRVITYSYTGSAPEILKNVKILKYNEYLLDIWSFGVIMFESIFGIPILESPEKSLNIERQIINGIWNIDTMILECLEKNSRSLNLWTSIPLKIKNVIIKCLSLVPEERPSMNDLINDIGVQTLTNTESSIHPIITEQVKFNKIKRNNYASIEREEYIKLERDKYLKIEQEYQEELKRIDKNKKDLIEEKKLLEIKQHQILKQKQEQSDEEMCLNIQKKENDIFGKIIQKQSSELEIKSREVEENIQKQKLTENIFPSEWTDVGSFNTYDPTTPGFALIDLDTSSSEYAKIFNIMNSNLYKNNYYNRINEFNKNIIKIERVQNPMAWLPYYYRIRMLSDRSGIKTNDIFQNANEHYMKHGTSETDPETIAAGQYGIDSRYSKQGFYGIAGYTAEDSLYSHGFRYNKNNNLAQMFIVRVAAGKIFEADNIFTNNSKEKYKACRHPPTGHDSIRGFVTPNNKAIMTYQPDSIYPEYLITYEK